MYMSFVRLYVGFEKLFCYNEQTQSSDLFGLNRFSHFEVNLSYFYPLKIIKVSLCLNFVQLKILHFNS